MLRRQKVAGILAETRDGAVVLGIGVNVNQTLERAARSGPARCGRRPAGSGRATTCSPQCSTPSAAATTQWLAGGLDAVYDGLGSRDFLRGRRVTVERHERHGGADRPRRPAADRRRPRRVVTVESGEVTYER